ncbi:hypothetical protein EDD86DRAFT_184714, partial [Gorgonomyces haynaldii]
STLFVSTLPFTSTKEQLEEFFSQVGPIRSCFIVKKDGQHTGCGYVQYAMQEDAEKAIKDLKKVKFDNKRTLKITWALKKTVVKERKEAGLPVVEEHQQRQLGKLKEKLKPKQEKTKKRMTAMVISGFTGVTKKQVYKKVRKFGEIAELVYPHEDDTKAFVQYQTVEEASDAYKHLHDHTFKSQKLQCTMIATESKAALAKKSRLIVRNLSFMSRKEHLQTVFGVYGKLVDCVVPIVDGKSKGFGFVQFENLEDAEKAIKGVNGQKILNRPVAVDWALAKNEYDRLAAEEKENPVEETEVEETVEEETESKEETVDPDQADIVDEDMGYEDEEQLQRDLKQAKESEQDRTLFIRNLSFETTEDTLFKSFKKFGRLAYAKITKDSVTKLSKGNGFVCFSKVEDAESCLKAFEKAQELHQVTQYEQKTSLVPEMPEALKEDQSVLDFTIDGRFVSVTTLVSKRIAQELTHVGKVNKRQKDKRNLYLMREGVIFPESEAAKTLTEQEMEKRKEQYVARKKLLQQNPNLFISKTRLSVRGIDSFVNDQILRQTAKTGVIKFWEEIKEGKREPLEREVLEEEEAQSIKPAPERRILIKQAKVLLDLEKSDTKQKVGKSKGFGFVEFEHHTDALACLRWMNNNPDAFSQDGKKAKRPIVEFATENNLVLKRREERSRNAKLKNAKTEDKTSKKRPAEDDGEQPAKKKKSFKERMLERQEKRAAKKQETQQSADPSEGQSEKKEKSQKPEKKEKSEKPKKEKPEKKD